MVDVASLTAISTVLGAVGGGMANEAGRAVWESAGSLVSRIAGREVPAPDGPAEREEVARIVLDGVRREASYARAWTALTGSVAPRRGGTRVPRTLPPSVRFFTDRENLMKALRREASRRADGTPRVVLLHGPEGVGTSALAVHWGSREGRAFPGGQLYADLRGATADSALDPAVALSRFLRHLGLPDDEIPTGVEERVERFRAETADRRLLVVLDHAHSAAQVRPLLTAAPGVFTVIVARRPLAGLDAVPVPVGPLSDRDAERLLTALAGKPAVTAARAALPGVLARCAGSPYALRAAAHLLTLPAAESGQATGTDPVTGAAESAYRELTPDAARAYRLLAARAWPSLPAPAAAAALNVTEPEAASLLAELARSGLLEATDGGRHRYRPAVRAHAERTAAREDGVLACAAAARRILLHHLEFAVTADRAAHPERWTLGPLYATLPPGPYASPAEALTALVAELDNLVEAVRTAEELDEPDKAWQLCEALWAAQLRAGRHDEVLPALRAGVRAARAPGTDPRVAARMHTQLALALTERKEYGRAETQLRAAADAARTAGDRRGQATAVETLGLTRLRQWRFAEAYDLFEEAGAHLAGIGPQDRGAADVPRARALLERHRGRALRGLGRWDEAREHARAALAYFRDSGDTYNTGRALTDLAETELAVEDHACALALINEAISVLTTQRADFALGRLRALRQYCVSATG